MRVGICGYAATVCFSVLLFCTFLYDQCMVSQRVFVSLFCAAVM